jgi:membrane fusion protein (multidrug efflux system)
VFFVKSGIPSRLLLGLLILGGMGCSSETTEEAGGTAFTPPPTIVETATVQRRTLTDQLHAVGSINASETITIVSEIDAIVTHIPFREGAAVVQGDLLVQLDDRERRAQLMRAEALREQAVATHKRVKRIVDEGVGSPQDLDDARAELQVAEAEVALARVRLTKTRILAAFDGVIGQREISPGAFLRAGEKITTLSQISELRISFSVPERFTHKLSLGAGVSVTTIAYPGKAYTGRIDVIDPTLDETTRNVLVIARVANPDGKLRPGMSANLSATLSEKADALTVVSEAIFAEGDQFLVYVVGADNTVSQVSVTLGLRLPDAVEVLSGLEAGQIVVRAGHQKLYPGAVVSPVTGGES